LKVVCDIEADGLENITQVWVVVCKDIATGVYYIFRNLTSNEEEKQKFLEFAKGVSYWIGHNWLGYDYPVLNALVGLEVKDVADHSCDTLVISKLVNYSREAHSIEQYGLEFGFEKGTFSDFSKYSKEMEDYCVRDVDICHRIFTLYHRVVHDHSWGPAIQLEQAFQLLVNDLHNNGFHFNTGRAEKLLAKVETELAPLDGKILEAFPPREVLIREFTPKATKHGTISKTSVPRSLWDKIADYEVGQTYKHTRLEEFNPSSHKQIIEVLNESGWSPTDKTKTHIEAERELQRLKRQRIRHRTLDSDAQLAILVGKLERLKTTGWKVNENNLSTLPPKAPAPARLLAKRILLEARRRSLTEWLGLVGPDSRIHGKFYGIGAWTHRMAHQNPNTANIPSEFREDGSVKLLGKELRQLWGAPKNRLLVGVDAEGIQLRIFAHYINDPEFTYALVHGSKADKTDPHSLNARVLGDVCKSRQAAKRFIYALLLGAGMGKLAEVLDANEATTKDALDRLLERYTGFAALKSSVIPADAKRGYFIGLDGRRVLIPGDTEGARRHLAMSGYLQNGEAIVMKKAALKWNADPEIIEFRKEHPILFVNMVHDEWQTEVPNDMKIAIRVAEIQANALKWAGEELGLKCPLAGSYYNDDHHDYTIGVNWYQTH